jgi:hypothetical protein
LSSLFTNLRLLDLDTLPDWPDVRFDTFTGPGVQGQKRRVQTVEWILVRLFELWDGEEAVVSCLYRRQNTQKLVAQG